MTNTPTSAVLTGAAAEAHVNAAVQQHYTTWINPHPSDQDANFFLRLNDLFERAIERASEYRLYNPWDYSLNETAKRTTLPSSVYLSVIPQADFGSLSAVEDDPDPDYVSPDQPEAASDASELGRVIRHAPRTTRNATPLYVFGGRRRGHPGSATSNTTNVAPAVPTASDVAAAATTTPAATPPNSTASTTSTTSTSSTDSSTAKESDSEQLKRRRRHPDFAVLANKPRTAAKKSQDSAQSTPRAGEPVPPVRLECQAQDTPGEAPRGAGTTLAQQGSDVRKAQEASRAQKAAALLEAIRKEALRKGQAVHSSWEVKRFPTDKRAGVGDSQAAMDLVRTNFRLHWRQLLEQGVCIFEEYPFMDTIPGFFVVGSWVRHFVLNKAHMPRDLDEIEVESKKSTSLRKYSRAFEGLEHPVYPLLQTKEDGTMGYTRAFMRHWEEANDNTLVQFIQPLMNL